MNEFDRLRTALARYKYPLLILLIGILLMLLPSGQKDLREAAEADEVLAAILSAAQGMGETHVLISENGVVVVCRGASSASVKLDIIRAVSSYTGFGSDKITILTLRNEMGRRL